MPSPGLRQFTIVLVTIVVQAAIGFNVDRSTETVVGTEHTADLSMQESVQVQNVINPNDIREDKDDTNKVTKNKDRFSSDAKDDNMEPTKNAFTDVTTVTDIPVANINATEVITNKYSELPNTEEFTSDITTFDLQTVTTDIQTPMESTTSSDEYLTDTDISVSSINITNIENVDSTDPSHIKIENMSLSSIGSSKIGTQVHNLTGAGTSINDQIAIDTRSKNNLNDSSKLSNASSTLNNTDKVDLKTITTQIPPTATLDAPGSKPEGGTFGSQKLIEDISQKDLFLAEQKVVHALNQITTVPASTREEFTTTDGERVLTLLKASLGNEKQNNMVEAETKKTTLSIPSLEKLTEDLISINNQRSIIRDPELSIATEAIPAYELIGNTQQETATVVSKRAGFLDFSKKYLANDEEGVTGEDSTSRPSTRPDAGAAGGARGFDTTKLTAYESRTLAEEAMREEELLKFTAIDFTKQSEGDQMLTNTQPEANTEIGMTNSEHVNEEALSVQPINQDRRTTLYTVGPKYKPMKRLEVQQAKAFVRDPDDNSWRNESISSLGIVFKPKNSSSKSFKEVLKTKTEIELSNSQDKDSKGEAPELRERLERITEVRKRKKMIDKFGEVVYTDYEEGGSAEGTGPSPADPTGAPAEDPIGAPVVDITGVPAADSAGTSSPEAVVVSTSPMTTTKSAGYWINQLEHISKEDIYRDLGLDVPTTHKPKKPYNLAEYYDTTDDYDADYMTMPNIDIKKYTVSTVSLKPSTAPPPRPASSTAPPPATRRPHQFPDRQPTLQYFPPTTRPPKVSINEYDVDFENRIKAYTQQTERSAPASRGTGDRLRMRPTVRPSDFTTAALTTLPAPHQLLISAPGLERGSFVIRHLGEFLGRAAAREEEARAPDFPAFTATPPPHAHPAPRDYEEPPYRRDLVDRFVDSFNLESDRFNVEFPVLVNSSVLHRAGGAGVASSSTFMKRLLGGGGLGSGAGARGCAAGACERLVELSPAYELHYYVPEQEERDGADGPERDPDRSAASAPYGAL